MTTNTKPVRTVTLGWEEYILPASMTDKQVIELVGTLALLDKVTSKGTKDYKVSHYYIASKQSVLSIRAACTLTKRQRPQHAMPITQCSRSPKLSQHSQDNYSYRVARPDRR